MGFAFAFLFYVAALMFGITLASSVVEEKQTRIVEIIAGAIPLRQLLLGKIAGNAVLAVGQMAVYVGVGLVGLAFTDYSGLIAGVSGAVAWFLAFFLAGFVALSCLWAVAGALASRTEDLQSTQTPVTMLVVLMFFGGLFLDGTARRPSPPSCRRSRPCSCRSGCSTGVWPGGSRCWRWCCWSGSRPCWCSPPSGSTAAR